jgi:hypothetical protein
MEQGQGEGQTQGGAAAGAGMQMPQPFHALQQQDEHLSGLLRPTEGGSSGIAASLAPARGHVRGMHSRVSTVESRVSVGSEARGDNG